MATKITEMSSSKMFGGYQKIFSHDSKELGCKMNFAIYLPPQAESQEVPVLYWLSGLTCNETNFIFKSGAQRFAAECGLIVVCPDTSPRNLNIPGDSDSWDFGVGAGFYLNATVEPWKKNYRMFDYVTVELVNVINSNFPVAEGKQSICGHSMGGHGALVCALKCPALYKSVSALAPISNPSQCSYGVKAFTGYLGPKDSGHWQAWDATELVRGYNGPPLQIFVDQGTEDEFYKSGQLLPENLLKACQEAQVPAVLKMREGYDHSYYYVATFIEEHVRFHTQFLKQ